MTAGVPRFGQLAAQFGPFLFGQGALGPLLRLLGPLREQPGLLQHLAQFFCAEGAVCCGRGHEEASGEQEEKRLHAHENGHWQAMVHVGPVKRLLLG